MRINPLIVTFCLLIAHAAFAAPATSEGTAPAEEIPGCEQEFVPVPGSFSFIKNLLSKKLSPDTKVGKIHYTRLPVFDESNPDENNFLFRWANRFHSMTKEHVLDNLVLFEPGQDYIQREVEESARILREQKYLYDANIRVVRSCDGKVDLEVVSRDVWSFNPEISYSRTGGRSKYRFAIRDTNIFGSGKQLGLASKQNIERSATELIYKDPNINGSRVTTRLEHSDNDDGKEVLVSFALPFYSLDSKRNWQLRMEEVERIDSQFFRGDEITEISHAINDYTLGYGFSKGLTDGKAKRWSIGYRYRKDRFAPGDLLPAPTPLPTEKNISYPFFAFELVEDNFAKTFDLDQIHRTEDLHLGTRLFIRAGYADEAFGSDQNRFSMLGEGSQALYYKNDTLWRHEFEWSGLWNLESRKTEDLLVEYEMRYFRGQTKHRSFVAILNVIYSKNLNSDQQVFLGGQTGLRGYTSRFQTGDRMFVLNLEERMYSDIHLFNLVRLGWAIFIDVGKAWEPGINNGTDNELLVNAGFGIRLASSKAEAGKIIHLDFAYPLKRKDDPEVDSVLFSVNIKEAF